jgi:hypothetical protein
MLVVAAGAATTWSGIAQADERVHAHLTYGPDANVERCPTERELRDAVAARIGYDPFDAAPGAAAEPREVIVLVHKRGGGIVGSLELRGPHPGQRELASPRGDCRELLDSFAVAIAIGLDPSSLTRPPGDPPPPAPAQPSVPPVVIEPPVKPAERPSPPPASEPIDVRLGGGPMVAFGELPAPAPGLAVSVGLRWRWLEPTLEGVATLPATQISDAGTVKASLLAVAVLPCGHAGLAFGCVGVTIGTLRGEGEGSGSPLHGSELYAAASVRGGAELAVTRSIWIRGYVEAVAPLTRITLQLAAQDVWRMPSVAARVGAAAGVRF